MKNKIIIILSSVAVAATAAALTLAFTFRPNHYSKLEELADLLETLVDRYVSLCAEHGVKPYGGHQDYETACLIEQKASEFEAATQKHLG